jgi:hypothetical protein
VRVQRPRCWDRVGIPEVAIGDEVEAATEVSMGEVEAVIDDSDALPAPGIVGPDACEIEIDPGSAAGLAGILEMPLVRQEII